MKPYSEMTKEELLELKRDLSDQYREVSGQESDAGYVTR